MLSIRFQANISLLVIEKKINKHLETASIDSCEHVWPAESLAGYLSMSVRLAN